MNRTQLLAALKLAAPALGKDTAAQPALSHFCFEGDSFYAYNDITAVVVGLKTGLTLGIHGETLLGVLETSRSEQVEVAIKGRTATLSGAGRVDLPTLERSDFLFSLPDEEPILSAPLGGDIRRALEICLISVADDSLRPEFNGVTLRIGKGGTILFSTDNNTATRMEPRDAKVLARKEAAVVLPRSAADLILKLFPKEGKPVMHVGERIAVVEFGGELGVMLVTKLLGHASNTLDSIFAQHCNGATISPLPEGLPIEIEKARVLTSRNALKECLLSASGKKLVISVDAALGKMRTELPLASPMKGEVVVNPDFVARILPHVTGLDINDNRSVVFFGEGLAHIVSAAPRAAAAPEVSQAPSRQTTVDDDIPF